MVDPHSPAFQAKAFEVFDAKIAAERKRKEDFGEVRPIIHTQAWNNRLVAVGNRIYSLEPLASFQDFLRDLLRVTLGDDWWEDELSKPLIARHPIAQWQARAEELMRAETPDARGRYLIPRDGSVTAYMTLAYDLYIARDNVRFQENIVERLRSRSDFVGTRYELLVAATFVRAGFRVEPEDESEGSRKHPEFVATHRGTNFAVAVEAKARNRRPSDRNPATTGVYDLVENAVHKAPAKTPFALFVDVAMPPEDAAAAPSWTHEVDEIVKSVVAKHGGMPGPFDWVLFTSIPHQYGTVDNSDPPRHFVAWMPRQTRLPPDIVRAIMTGMEQYGRIPEFESGS